MRRGPLSTGLLAAAAAAALVAGVLALAGRAGPGSAGVAEQLGHVHAVALDPADPHAVWLGAHHGLYRSGDGGRTFMPVLVGTDTMAVVAAGGSGGGWFAAGHGFFYWSADGRAWQAPEARESVAGLPWPDVHGLASVGPGGRLVAWIAGAGPFASGDGGRAWRALEVPAPDVEDAVVATAGPVAPGETVPAAVAARDGRIWLLEGSGWTALPAAPGRVTGLAFEPAADGIGAGSGSGPAGTWWAAGPDGLWRYDQGAGRWERRSLEPAGSGAGPEGSGWPAAVTVGHGGEVLVASWSGELWRQQPGAPPDTWERIRPAIAAGLGAPGSAPDWAGGLFTGAGASDPVGVRTMALARRLRCPICVGLSVAESDTFISVQIREFIHDRLAAGESEEAIVAYLAERYGPGILWDPPKRGAHAWAWLVPAMALAAGALVVAGTLAGRRGPPAGPHPGCPPEVGPVGTRAGTPAPGPLEAGEAEAIDAAVRDVM